MLHDYVPRTVVRHNTNIIINQCSVYWWESVRMDADESVCTNTPLNVFPLNDRSSSDA